MRINLRRDAGLTALEAVMEIGREEKRKDIVSVLIRAKELGGAITPEDICSSLLIDRPIALGRTVITRCRDLGLLDAQGRLTALGEESIERKTVPLPEYGRYRVLCTTDPLVPQRILDLEDVPEPGAELIVRERRAARRGESERNTSEGVSPVPSWFARLKGSSVLLPRTGERIRVLSIANRCIRSKVRTEERLTVRWTLYPDRESELRAEGLAKWSLEAPEVSHESIFLELLGDQRSAWDPRRGILRCRFKEIDDAEKATMTKSIRIREPTLSDYGGFDDTVIRDVPIAPRTTRDAQEWAEWMLEHEIREYLDEDGYSDLLRRLESRFSGFKVSMPDRDKAARDIRRKATAKDGLLPPSYWHLQAPLDLGRKEGTQ